MGVVTTVVSKVPVIGAAVTFGVLAKNVVKAGAHAVKGEGAEMKNELAQAAVRGVGVALKTTGVGTVAGVATDFVADEIAARKKGNDSQVATPGGAKPGMLGRIYDRVLNTRSADGMQMADSDKATPKA